MIFSSEADTWRPDRKMPRQWIDANCWATRALANVKRDRWPFAPSPLFCRSVRKLDRTFKTSRRGEGRGGPCTAVCDLIPDRFIFFFGGPSRGRKEIHHGLHFRAACPDSGAETCRDDNRTTSSATARDQAVHDQDSDSGPILSETPVGLRRTTSQVLSSVTYTESSVRFADSGPLPI